MKRTYFITGTDTGAGKTVLTALLVRHLLQNAVSVAAFKPVCSGGRDDAQTIFAALDGAMMVDEINPWHFRAAIAPSLAAKRERKVVSISQVLAHIRATRRDAEVTLVEGSGGLLSPLGRGFNSRDLILALRASPIVVSPNKLGVVNHLLLTLEALPKSARAKAKVVLMSTDRPDSSTATNAQLLGEFFPPKNIFTLPWLGKMVEMAAALKNSRVRQTLQKII